ncbi:hypothetical protein ACFL47_05200 [Candidatus Latescibacterota bacterium]
MIHKLCVNCINPCKQEDYVKIARCPKFIKRVSENEFLDLIDEIDSMGSKVDELRKRTKQLIAMANEQNGKGVETTPQDSFNGDSDEFS